MLLSDAQWIGMPVLDRGRAAPMFRRTFHTSHPIASAELHICGLGWYEAWINGKRVGDHVLDPAQTDYEVRCLYVTYDVTSLLHRGDNALGVILGDGWFNQDIVWKKQGSAGMEYGEPRLLAELVVHYENGQKMRVCSDERWRCAIGAIISSNVYAGEQYDARLEQPGWNMADFDDSSWNRIETVPPPGGRLEPQRMPPVRVIEEIRPTDILNKEHNRCIVDMGQNFAGWARVQLQAPAGTDITFRFAEHLDADNELDTSSTGTFATGVEQIDSYICSGKGIETWHPRFTYHGFRYLEITGWPGNPSPEQVTGMVLHTDLPRSGFFECSDPHLNQLHKMVGWTHRSNLHGIPEDCPARERCGWLGDAHIICEYSIYNFYGESFWEKYLDDIESARLLNGGLPPKIAPGKRGRDTAKPDWMAALILIPWYLYVYYGNRRVLEKHFAGMQTVLEHFHACSENGILDGGYGDWCDPKNSTKPTYTPVALTTTIWFYECARIMTNVATFMGKSELAVVYSSWMQQAAQALQARWFNEVDNSFGSQTADAMALYFGLVPEGQEQNVVDSLVKNIRDTHCMHHSCGIMGIRFLFEVLTHHGHGDIAYSLLQQNSYPSFGYLIKRGATTLWEYWGGTEVDNNEGPRSLNHPMMGGFENWFYNTLAGIRPASGAPGFRRFTVKPYPIPNLSWINAYHDCPTGRIASQWQQYDDQFRLTVQVPTNSTACVHVPVEEGAEVLLKGEFPSEKVENVRDHGTKGDRHIFEIAGGKYHFQKTGPASKVGKNTSR